MAELIDRVPTKPNRMKIVPENGTEFFATLELADEPRVSGTKLMAQNIVDTLLPMSENKGVGTVIYTARPSKEIDGRWQKCDGSEVDKGRDPKLWAALADLPLRPCSVAVNKIADELLKGTIKYLNGIYVACLDGYVAYTEDLRGVWQLSKTSGDVIDIVYGNGYWVISTYSSTKGTLRYTTDLSSGWTVGKSEAAAVGKARLFFFDGKFYAWGYGKTTVYAAEVPNSWSSAGSVDSVLSPTRVVWCEKYGCWLGVACSSETVDGAERKYSQLYSSDDLLTWDEAGEKICEADVLGVELTVKGCYMGIDEEYINLYGGEGVIGIKTDGSGGVGTVFPIEPAAVGAGVCIGAGEMLVGLTGSGTAASPAVYWGFFRQSAAGEFELADTPPISTISQPLFPLEVRAEGSVFYPVSVSGGSGVCALDKLYGRYRPEIASDDATKQVVAFIKAK